MVIETSGSNEEHDTEKLNAFLGGGLDDGTVLDGIVAQDGAQARALIPAAVGEDKAMLRLAPFRSPC